MTNKQEAIEKINQATELLFEALKIIENENSNGKQFDYCTSSKLSDRTCTMSSVSNRISKIVFQE